MIVEGLFLQTLVVVIVHIILPLWISEDVSYLHSQLKTAAVGATTTIIPTEQGNNKQNSDGAVQQIDCRE
jgi:hypothetical protein